MWRERRCDRPNYVRMDYVQQQHHARYRRYVETHGLICQNCGGFGGDHYTPYSEPPEPCGWCETTGRVTRWLRGQWLREMKAMKAKKKA